MNIFESQITELRQLIQYGNYDLLTKRIIDFTLDTEDLIYYKKTIDLLDWLDTDPDNMQKVKRFESTINDLHHYLASKFRNDAPQQSVLLSVSDLTRSYLKSSFSLGPLSFCIREGEIIGLVGENGNGKTTLLRLLCGELVASSGNIKCHFPYEDHYDLRSHLIYIPQRTNSWHGSLLSNLQFTATCYGILGEENEYTVQLIIARMGLRKFRGHSWKNLSSGYKMRFELARALLRKPKLLLIDEPLANLDILAQQTVLDDFKDIARSPFRPLGIVLSSQQLYEVEKTSDEVIFLKDGQPRNLNKEIRGEQTEIPKFIIEFETDWTQEVVNSALSALELEKLQINGGTYVAYFPFNITLEDFLKLVLETQMPITYFRNISNSTRRFFLS